ncbi:MAG: LlaJI family restriction endonuclease [Campylobacteraceae bacterium]|nr:LlaJI family restriction endonuclease [Campylobacteraceae bacterium]
MRIFIERESYNKKLLESLLGDKFYTSYNKDIATIDQVGYFHCKNNELIYLLPKVFINKDGLILNKYTKEELSTNPISEVIDDTTELNWLRRFLIIFYKSLIEYKTRYNSTILRKEDIHQLNTTIGESEFSYLDISLSIINFYKKNKNTILYITREHESQRHKSVKWNKTIRKSDPYFTNSNEPIYLKTKNKKKEIDNEEELLTIYYSVLYHLKKEFYFNITFDTSYAKYKGTSFEKISKKAPKILKRIRYKYYSDILIKIYNLLQIYFSKSNAASIKNKQEDYIMVKDYHWVFEDMIDKLFSDNLREIKTNKGISLKKLKSQKDGKEVDHIFEYNSLIDCDENIYYIGDSKYYKSNNNLQENSIYKQFTYAKNVIQFNIDLLNEKKVINQNLRYRDEITEGYNITPNFFIQGVIEDFNNFDNHNLSHNTEKRIEHSFHYKDRLFDRDSLYVYYYDINFLFVLSTYTKKDFTTLYKFRDNMKKEFRKNFIQYFKKQRNFMFYYSDFENINSLENFVNKNFKILNGKIYRSKPLPNRLIFAIYKDDLEITSKISHSRTTGLSICSFSTDSTIELTKFNF